MSKLSYRKMGVVLVDQLSMALDALETALAPFDFYRVWRARNAEETMGLLHTKQVNLLIVASKLQPLSGAQIVGMVRQAPILKGLPILMTTEKGVKDAEQRALTAGANGILEMPLQAEAVRSKVDEVLSPLVDEKEEEFMQAMTTARKAMRLGDVATAENSFRAALAVRADEDAQVALGSILKNKGDLDGAASTFMASLRSHPQSMRSFQGLAEVYQAQGRLEDALKVLAAAVNAAKRIKDSGEAQVSLFFYMGELQLELRKLQEAMGLFEKAIASDPNNASLQVKVGETLIKAGFNEEAERFLINALEMDPEPAHVYNSLGMAYRRQNKWHLAIRLYRKALVFHPKDEHLIYNMARCYWEMEQDEPASRLLTHALKLNPEFKEAEVLLQLVLKRLGFKVEQEQAREREEDQPVSDQPED